MRPLLIAIALSLSACSTTSDPEPVSDPGAALWAAACARLSGCEPYVSTPNPIFTCRASGWSYLVGTEPAECVLEAPDCDAAVGCFGAGAAPTPCVSDVNTCDGDILRECDSGIQLEIARDCAAEGLRCRLNDFGQAHCALEASCDAERCEGDVPVHCFGGVAVPWASCAPGRCVEDEGSVTCGGEGEPCDGPIFRCDGDVAVTCNSGYIQREQCRPGACRTDDGARCLETDECVPHCEGNSIVQCVEGRVESYDCTSWGYEACEDDGSGVVSCR